MPLAAGDAGVFVCGPDDIAPWERPARRARHTSIDVPRAPRRPAVWLVLNTCPDCLPRTERYCHNHNASNWWLTTMASATNGGKRKSARPES
jgi:hypothetical protein